MEENMNASGTFGNDTPAQTVPAAAKPPFVAPKLTFVKPELVRQGSLADVTAGFFGSFTP